MTAYYNEIDLAAADVLEQLIADDVIAPGIVDTRTIKEVQPNDLAGFTQCHFFAGGGLWSVAARLAGWPDDRPLWTGSCPCQPFSAAGKGLGTDDPRHLWPDFHRLIRSRRPAVVMGEQVAGAPGYGWLDGVRADLESEGYASRGVDIPACAIDAPHQRNRLYWVAVEHAAGERRREGRAKHEFWSWWPTPAGADAPSDMANGLLSEGGRGGPGNARGSTATSQGADRENPGSEPSHSDGGRAYRLHADADGGRRPGWSEVAEREAVERAPAERHLLRNGSWWADHEWITCHDEKTRRTKPGLPLLVDGLPGRVDLWRIAGNAISPILASEVISSFMEAYADA